MVAPVTTACHRCSIERELLVPTPDPAASADERPESRPCRGVRLFVAGFLGLFLLSGLIGVEAWPLTGWKMYSRLRHGDFWGWQVLAVEGDGTERHVDLRNAPAAYHGATHLLSDFEGLSSDDRQATCLGLAEAARRQYPDVAAVAVDHVLGRIPVDPDGPPPPPSRRIRVYRCRVD